MKLAIVSGGFDPVHVGHIELFEKAKGMADDLLVIVNDDAFLERKKGKPFMPLTERLKVVESLKPVTMVVESSDEDDTVCNTLQWIRALYKSKYKHMMFCNGGDRTGKGETPEHITCEQIGIKPVYGLGEKIQSSSWLLKKS
jgi:cytidyltransferase-like protein|tara:strand:- start:174 stop:599 length:426 start_codon:yes stop_codon:yes gene_type:complete